MSNSFSRLNLKLHHWQTPAGAPVFFVEAHEIPIVEIAVLFNAGSSQDGSHFGLAEITNLMIGLGTRKKNAEKIAKDFDEVGAYFNASVDRDISLFSLKTISHPNFLNRSVKLFSDVVSNPNFPDEYIALTKNRILQQISQEKQLPESIVKNLFFNLIYKNHPYGHPIIGTKESIIALNKIDLSHFYAEFYTQKNAMIVITGDIKINKAKELAITLTKTLPLGKKATLAAFHQRNSAKEKKINMPSIQTHILIGKACINPNSPDYFPLLVGNQILGGDPLNSILFREIRSQRGLVYTIASALMLLKNIGPFVIVLETQNQKTTEALKLVDQIVTTFIHKGPTPSELDSVKSMMLNEFPFSLDSNHATLKNLIKIATYSLPINYLHDYTKKISNVTLSQVKAAFKQNIVSVDSLVKAIVGGNNK